MKLTEEQQLEGIKKLREKMGITPKSLGVIDDNGIARVKCSDFEDFPNPPSFWIESKLSVYRLISDDAEDYIRAWEFNGLRVLASVIKYSDGRDWLHVSFSRKSRIPDYKDIQLVRKSFIGEDKKSIMVFPSMDHYVNIHENTLHLWYTKDNPVPDFDINISGIGPSI